MNHQTTHPSIKRIGRAVRDTLLRLGLGPRIRDENRQILEKTVFKRLASDESVRDVLFVGCHWYTWHYERLIQGLAKQQRQSVASSPINWSTIDIDPERARYGAQRHIVGSATDLVKHFGETSFDCVMLIGVFGWGVNDTELADEVLNQSHAVLRPGGECILGIDEKPSLLSFEWSQLDALAQFQPSRCKSLETHRYECSGELRHAITFWEKP